MMRGSILFPLILLWSTSAVQAQPPNLGKLAQSENHQSQGLLYVAKPSDRGTEQLPIVVEVIESEADFKQRAISIEQSVEELANSRTTLFLTGGLLVVAIVQIFLFWWQLRILQSTTRDAGLAAIAAGESVNIAREVGKKQLRAYMVLGPLSLLAIDRRNPKFVGRLVNCGATPARKVQHGYNIRIDDYPPDSRFYAGNVQTLRDKAEVASITVAPGVGAEFETEFSIPLDNEHLRKIAAGAFAVYICGIIEYEDIFGDAHRTTYSLYSTAAMFGGDDRMRCTDEGNEFS